MMLLRVLQLPRRTAKTQYEKDGPTARSVSSSLECDFIYIYIYTTSQRWFNPWFQCWNTLRKTEIALNQQNPDCSWKIIINHLTKTSITPPASGLVCHIVGALASFLSAPCAAATAAATSPSAMLGWKAIQEANNRRQLSVQDLVTIVQHHQNTSHCPWTSSTFRPDATSICFAATIQFLGNALVSHILKRKKSFARLSDVLVLLQPKVVGFSPCAGKKKSGRILKSPVETKARESRDETALSLASSSKASQSASFGSKTWERAILLFLRMLLRKRLQNKMHKVYQNSVISLAVWYLRSLSKFVVHCYHCERTDFRPSSKLMGNYEQLYTVFLGRCHIWPTRSIFKILETGTIPWTGCMIYRLEWHHLYISNRLILVSYIIFI